MFAIIGYGALSLIVLLLVLLCIPVFVQVTYREDLQLCVRFLGITVYRFPTAKPPRERKTKTEKSSALAGAAKRFRQDSVGKRCDFLNNWPI